MLEGLRVQRERVSTSVQCIIFIIYVNKTEESSFTAVSTGGFPEILLGTAMDATGNQQNS